MEKGYRMATDLLTATLIGGPTVLLEIGGFRLLTDPTFDPPGSYEAKGIVLAKHTSPAITPTELGPVDLVLLSHDQHFDNLDHAGRAFLSTVPTVITTEAGAARLGMGTVGLQPWASTEVPLPDGRFLQVTATPARHGPVGIEPISGDVIGFVLRIGSGPAIYISGDTVWYEQVAEVGRRFDVRLAILFTGCAEPRGPFHVTMDSNDAIEAAYAFPNAKIIAVHNEGWGHFTQTQDDVAKAFATLGIGGRLELLQRGIATGFAWTDS
jgi:L-ascorbate metabolism protein UlaG (beta-lactamase superfamily)